MTKIGPWSRVGKLLEAAPRRMKVAFDKALLQEAQFLRTKIVEGIRRLRLAIDEFSDVV